MDLRFVFTVPGIPRRTISRCAGRMARMRAPKRLRGILWPFLAARFRIPREEVPGDWVDYPRFLDVFIRPRPGMTAPPPEARTWVSPADGTLVESCSVTPEGTWVIKGTPYSTLELLGETDSRLLQGARAMQIYLAPYNYHRYHAPCALEVLEAVTWDGDLQPVDPDLARRSLRVLERNRRILLRCRERAGAEFSLLFVGAMNVGRMIFHFDQTLGGDPPVEGARSYDPPPVLGAGEEMGWFELGSTIVMFTPPDRKPLIENGGATRAGEPILGPVGNAEH